MKPTSLFNFNAIFFAMDRISRPLITLAIGSLFGGAVIMGGSAAIAHEATSAESSAAESSAAPMCGECRESHGSGHHGPHGHGHGHKGAHHHHGRGFGISLIPSLYSLEDTDYADAFTDNGFQRPENDLIGMSWLVWWTTAQNWRLGLGAGSVYTNEESGGSQASYMDSYGGVFIGKDLVLGSRFDLTLGSLIGYGTAETEVFSATRDGRVTERGLVLEPRVSALYQIGNWVSLGVSGSYLYPVSPSSKRIGDDLGLSDISAQGWAVGLELVLGRGEAK